MQTRTASTNPTSVRRVGIIALAMAIAIQAAVLYWPSVSVSGPVSWSDKVLHALIFMVPAGLVAGLFPRRLWPLVLIAVHAPASELVQYYLVPSRSGDLVDVAADLAGVAAGSALGWWASRLRWSGSPPQAW